eukprot:scaffold7086_cov120-Isochrysis_galbana.AAC.3
MSGSAASRSSSPGLRAQPLFPASATPWPRVRQPAASALAAISAVTNPEVQAERRASEASLSTKAGGRIARKRACRSVASGTRICGWEWGGGGAAGTRSMQLCAGWDGWGGEG